MSDVPCDKHSQDHRDGCAECCVDELQFREVERTGLLETSEKHCKALVLRLDSAQLWIDAVKSCQRDVFVCACGHEEPWWAGSNADEITKDILVEKQ